MKTWMKTSAALCGLIAILATSATLAHVKTQGSLQVIHPWVSPSHDHSTHAHPTIANNGDEPITLVGIEAEIADSAAFLIGEWQVSEIVLPGGEILAPEEFRVILTGLQRPLTEGDHFEATLKIEDADDVVFHMVVGENTEMPDMEMMMDGKSMDMQQGG